MCVDQDAYFHSECNADDVCKGSGGMCVYSSTTPNKKVCLCVDGFVVASGENCTGMYDIAYMCVR